MNTVMGICYTFGLDEIIASQPGYSTIGHRV